MPQLEDTRVAVIASEGVEEPELTEPVRALKEAGARVDVISPDGKAIQAFRHHDKGDVIPADRGLDQIRADEYDGVVLPGGALNADFIRVDVRNKRFLQEMQNAGKPVAAICHAPWELISAGLVRGRRLTSYHTIQDDIRNAGGEWVDEEVCVDDNWVTSRKPDDIPAFNREVIRLLGRVPVSAG